MFAGGRRRTSNIKVMQLFHELKQQFPTIPDHIVTACITNFVNPSPENVFEKDSVAYRQLLEAAAALRSSETKESMGRTLTKPSDPITSLAEPLDEINSFEIEQSDLDFMCKHNNIFGESEHMNEPQENISLSERRRSEMNESVGDFNQNVLHEPKSAIANFAEKKIAAQRPTHLEIKRDSSVFNPASSCEIDTNGFNKIQPSERCLDLQKLFNTENLNNKPPKSPLSIKRFSNAKNSPTKSEQSVFVKSHLNSLDNLKKATIYHGSGNSASASTSGISSSGSLNSGLTSSVSSGFKSYDSLDKKPKTTETPTQTTEALISSGSVNLSLNVNCQMDLVQTPKLHKHTSVLQVTPQLPWCQDPTSQRSYTSVNLTLRPPSTEPQPPIDITSQNSSLTYSTSSFDPQKGLESRLQITVGPGGGSVSSIRTRPSSSYHPHNHVQETVPVRTSSLPDLTIESKSSVIYKQRACIERLRTELITEKGRLIAMQEEVASLETPNSLISKVDAEIEKQLQKEIRHLRGQCERLTYDIDRKSESKVPLGETNEEFYRNIYTGQRGTFTSRTSINQSRHIHHQGSQLITHTEIEDPKWNCHMCTFQNHPLLDKCEQCDMPRILHGMKSEPPNPCLAFGMIRPLGQSGPYSPNQVFNNNNNNNNNNGREFHSQTSNHINSGANNTIT